MRFTDAYAGAPVCGPSRCTLLTGLHTGHATVRQNPEPGQGDQPLAQGEPTLGTVLQAAGYRTALFGKWGFAQEGEAQNLPGRFGFDEFFGYLSHRDAHDYYPDHLWDGGERVELPENAGDARETYAPDLFAERALDFVDRSADDPFLLFLSTNMPHFPQQIPDLGPYADTDWTEGNKAHAAQITLLDTQVGQIVERLEQLGIAEDTIVLFTGDNGPHEEGAPRYEPAFFDSSGGLKGLKRNLYEGGIRVPLIAWGPGRVTAGVTSDHVTAFWDVLPTLADLALAAAPPDLDGLSLRGVLTGEGSQPEHDYLYWWRLDPYGSATANAVEQGRVRNAAEAVRRGDWKAVRIAPGRDRDVADHLWDVQLYDLAADPGEQADLADSRPGVAQQLVALMHQAWVPPPYEREPWSPDGLTIAAPAYLAPGRTTRVTTTFTNHGPGGAVHHIGLRLHAPSGWTVRHASTLRARALDEGASFEVAWDVTPAAGSAGEDPELVAEASWRAGCIMERAERIHTVALVPPPPTSDAYLSDLAWLAASNGYGPVERDTSNGGNGGNGAGDGAPITIRDTVYEKGLGVHAPSRISFYLGGNCARFTADVGIDDFSADRQTTGDVVFQVWGDGTQRFDSGLLVSTDAPLPVDVDVTGVEVLELVVTNGGDDISGDNSSWAAAMVHCP